MMPVNTKSMFSMLCQTLDKLDRYEIDVAQAAVIAKVIGQAHNLLNYELKRAALMCNAEFRDQHRNLEIKTFDSLKS